MAEVHRILVVDDEPEQVLLLDEVLSRLGYAVTTASGGQEALNLLSARAFDLAVVDLKMPGVDGLEVLDYASHLLSPPEVILVTGYPSLESAQKAIERGVHDYLIKPLNYAELGAKVRKALERRLLSRENLTLREIASIHEATRRLTLAHGLDGVLELIMEECFGLTHSESGSIMLVPEEGSGLVVRVVRGRTDDRVLQVGTRLTEGIACRVARIGEPVLIREGEITPDIGVRLKADWSLGSAISLPLKVEERVLGVVNLNRSAEGRPFDHVDLSVANVMAMQAGVSIENAILKDRLLEKIDELKEANRRVEEAYREVMQAEKLSAIGLMAGTVAHDINNPLAVIDGRTQLLLYKLGEDSDVGESLKSIKAQTDRIANLVRGLRNYARKTRQEMRSINVVEHIEESFILVDKLLYENGVKTIKHYPENLPPIQGNATEVEQVFMNLIQNAAQAMEKGGELTITVRVTDQLGDPATEPQETEAEAPEPGAQGKEAPPASYGLGDWVEVTVADTGTGIPPEALKAVFEPFYTTKAEGKGTGLGLPICKRILQEHHGDITVDSAVGKGTSFCVRFPIPPEGGTAA